MQDPFLNFWSDAHMAMRPSQPSIDKIKPDEDEEQIINIHGMNLTITPLVGC